jgi:hypothetical protein
MRHRPTLLQILLVLKILAVLIHIGAALTPREHLANISAPAYPFRMSAAADANAVRPHRE